MPTRSKKAQAAVNTADALPVLTFVVDADLGIRELNGAARAFLGPKPEKALRLRQGDAFHCAHRNVAHGGCGRGKFCEICPIREAALLAWNERRIVRRRTKVEAKGPDGMREVHMLVTATPLPSRGPARVLLALEDINALIELQQTTPICAACRRVRDDDQYWQQFETHLREHFDLDLSHGVCVDCGQQLYGNALSHP